jgi:hypothetical protein
VSERCKIVEVVQGTAECDALRRGRLTASHAGDWLAKPTTKRYRPYQQQIVLELLGYEEQEPDAHWMDHGRAGEPFARGAYCWKHDCDVTADVFCIHSQYDWAACSPDGLWLPDLDRAIEIKCRLAYRTYLDKVRDATRLGRIDPSYKPQVQAQMWVMGLPAIDYVEFWRDPDGSRSKMHVTEVSRDDAYIEQLEHKAMAFMLEAYRLAEKDTKRIAA